MALSGTDVVVITILTTRLSLVSYTGLSMLFERTLAALTVYRRVMDEGPTFGDGSAKVKRWDTECLTAAVGVREAFWLDSGADPQTRDACFSMSIDEVRRAANCTITGLHFTRTREAIATYYRECAAGPDSYPGWINGQQWRRTCDDFARGVREKFFHDAAGAYSWDQCLALSVADIQCLLPRARNSSL